MMFSKPTSNEVEIAQELAKQAVAKIGDEAFQVWYEYLTETTKKGGMKLTQKQKLQNAFMSGLGTGVAHGLMAFKFAQAVREELRERLENN